MKVAAIIVNYRTAKLTARAADALLLQLEQVGPYHLYIVDNDSGDGSYAALRQEALARNWGERVTVAAAPRNGGYGYGINFAIEMALQRDQAPEYFYVLNSDAFADEGSLRRLVDFMDARPDAGLAGSNVHAPDGESQGAAFRFPTVHSELEGTIGVGILSRMLERYIVAMGVPAQHLEVDWIPGTSMLIRRAALEGTGLFDEAFFLYFEEVDFAKRLWRAGWKCCFVAGAPITHIGCVSTGMLDHKRRMPRYWFDSRHRYFLKHHGRAYAVACDVMWLLGQVGNRAKRKLVGPAQAQRPRLLRDFAASSARHTVLARRPAPDSAVIAPKLTDGVHTRVPGSDTRAPEEMRLLELLLEDLHTYERDVRQPGLWALVAHRLGRRASALPAGTKRSALEMAYALMFTLVDWTWGIHLPRSVRVGRRLRLWHNGCMLLTAREIGNDVHIRHDTTFDTLRERDGAGLPVIEDRAELGSGVCVLGDVRIGHDARVGANSVVIKSVPPKAMVIGVPARIVPL